MKTIIEITKYMLKRVLISLLLCSLPLAVDAKAVHGNRSGWSDIYPSKGKCLYKQNFETVDNIDYSDWTSINAPEALSIVGDTEGKYLQFSLEKRNGRNLYTVWGKDIYPENFSKGVYHISFEWYYGRAGNNQFGTEISLFTGASPETNNSSLYDKPNTLFSFTESADTRNLFFLNGDVSNNLQIAEGEWYYIEFTIDTENYTLSYSINNLSLTQFVEGVRTFDKGTDMLITGINMYAARYWSILGIDNIKIWGLYDEMKVADAPKFSVNGNILSMSTNKKSAKIYYTLDGSAPTTSSTVYSAPITLSNNCIVKAIAEVNGCDNSDISTFFVNWLNNDVLFSATAGSDLGGELWGSERINDTYASVTGGGIAYIPSESSTDDVTNDVIIMQRNRYAFLASDYVSFRVNLDEPLKAGDIIQAHILSRADGDIGLFFSANNTRPSSTETAIILPKANSKEWVEVPAYTVKTGDGICGQKTFYVFRGPGTSTCFTNFVIIRREISPVVFNLVDNRLTMSSKTEGATIYYTMDGSTPTTSSSQYTSPITLTQNCTIKAIAVADGYENSDVATYVVDWFKVEPVTITFSNLKVQMATQTANARIYYTTDGSTPTENSTRYTEPFSVTNNCTVKAIAYKDNFNPSDVTSKAIDVSQFVCSTPTFQRSGNTVAISCNTEGATIYYTLDGSSPTANSNLYSGALTLTQNCTINAIAVKQNWFDSQVSSYVVDWFKVEPVVITFSNLKVQMATQTANARIYYTTDGSTPTENSTRYTEPFSVTNNCTVKAIAYKDNFNPSDVTSKAIDVSQFVCSTPTFQRSGNTVAISCNTEGATIYYTLDGSSPTANSNLYSGALTLTQNCTINAIAVKQGWFDSQVSSYVVDWFKVADVTITYVNGKVEMSTTTGGARIFYTTDGTTPTESSTRYTEPFTVSASCTVKAIAYKDNFNSSAVTSKDIDVSLFICSAPTFKRTDNTVTIACATEGATIYYTLDGTTPTASSSVYTNAITLTQNCTIKAISTKQYYQNSQVATYAVDWFKVEPVIITFSNLKVQMTTQTANARIYYTTDGSTPTENSTRYTEPFSVAASCTVRAIAYKDNFNPSDVSSLYVNLEDVRCDMPTFQMTGRQLTIMTTTEAATIYYTLDGSEPTTASSRYTGPVELTRNGTVKAVAVRDGYLNSPVGSYEVTYFQVEMPSFTADGSVLTITCGTVGAAIYYIIGDGQLSVNEQNRYTGSITLTDNRAVRAIGVLDGYRNSSEAVYNHSSITCGDVQMEYDGRYMRLSTATEGARIYYTTDGSNPTVNSLQYSGEIIIDGLCTVSAVAVKENTNNSKVASMDIPYLYDGRTATVREGGQLSKAFEWSKETVASNMLEVRGNLNSSDLAFIRQQTAVEHLQMDNVTLEGGYLPDNAFANMGIVSIELPMGVTQAGKNLFEGCAHLSAVIWHADIELTGDMMAGVSNPNLLYYVNRFPLAPQADNVVNLMTGRATNIQLHDVTDGSGDFYCPRAFTASNISYTRNFKLSSGIGASAGWETIALPFTVAEVQHETNGLLAPFGSNVAGAKPFWLFSLQSTGFNPAMEIVANTPYIICMPNHTNYADEFNQGGSVTFTATNVEIPVTTTVASRQETSSGYISLYPAYSRLDVSNNIYTINKEEYKNTFAPGSIFVPGLRDVLPFEAYSTVEMKSQVAVPPLYIPIFKNQMPTGIAEMLKTRKTTNDAWYTLDGRKLQAKPIQKGVYIQNGRKVVVR